MLARGDPLSKSMSDYLVTELQRAAQVVVRLGVDLVDGEEDEQLEAIVVHDRNRGTTERIPTSGLFVMIGAEPRTDWLEGAVARDENGFVLTGAEVSRRELASGAGAHAARDEPAGVFAAGDVRRGSVKRVTTAMGEGATAIQHVHEYLAREDERERR